MASSIIDEIKQAIENLDYGSVEVIVQNHEVTQISTRIIKKTVNHQANNTSTKKASSSNVNVNFKY